MTSADLPSQGLVFWPVGNGDSTTIVIDDQHVVQVDIHDMAQAVDEDTPVTAVVDRLVEVLPQTADGEPYLSLFVLTHADQDHCQGFADLLERVKIGEIWATPRLWREYTERDVTLCADAEAFHQEARRRVAATVRALRQNRPPASGDRIRVIGTDEDADSYTYSNLPDEYISHPGDLITLVDGEDLAGTFEAFVHAPFKDDCAAERNDTSLALQVTLLGDAGTKGKVLLFGDLAHDTIMKIFEYSEQHGRPERVDWDLLLGPHHCSKKVMYISQDGRDVLQQDVLDALERHALAGASVVVSSKEFPTSNSSGDNPPHVKARNRYQELVGEVLCTAEHPNVNAPQPIVFALESDGLVHLPPDEVEERAKRVSKSAAFGRPRRGVLVEIGATKARRRGPGRPGAAPRQAGLDRVRGAVTAARGDSAAPQQPVGFGGW